MQFKSVFISGVFFFLTSLISINCKAQSSYENSCVTAAEKKLYELIMEYRKSKGLGIIPFSKSLSYVAHAHAVDINDNLFEGECNMHSWSDKGAWKGCCYTNDHKNASCMWDKPGEMTKYKGDGFEIAHGGRGAYVATPESALNGWKNSKYHDPVIVNEGIWADMKWNAIGVGIYNGYAVVWFGREQDPDGNAEYCK